MATDACGSAAFITGYTTGVMAGQALLGAQDIFVARYEGDGTLRWVRQFGAGNPAKVPRNDTGYGITVDRRGDVVVVGDVIGSFGSPNPNIDRTDWSIMKLRPADGSVYAR